MQASTLLSKLRHLTLAGYENGNYIWAGQDHQWRRAELEEKNILTMHDNFPVPVRFLKPVDIDHLGQLYAQEGFAILNEEDYYLCSKCGSARVSIKGNRCSDCI